MGALAGAAEINLTRATLDDATQELDKADENLKQRHPQHPGHAQARAMRIRVALAAGASEDALQLATVALAGVLFDEVRTQVERFGIQVGRGNARSRGIEQLINER